MQDTVKNLELGYHELYNNYGYYIDNVPLDVIKDLDEFINQLSLNFNKGKKINDRLAGHIKKEYVYKPNKGVGNFIKGIVSKIEKSSKLMQTNIGDLPKRKLHISDFWVNFQEKYEFNPLHSHSGIYSVVIWHKIPYKYEDEQKYFPDRPNATNGMFSFHYPFHHHSAPNIGTLILLTDKSAEGKICIFPSNLQHAVSPFYSSDDYRITFSCNIHLNSQ